MKEGRLKRIIKSSASSLLLKAVTFICVFLLTKQIIKSFGSETNGMISSIGQFLGIIALAEGGVGGVARALLYKPLSNKDTHAISKIVHVVERFFRILSLFFVAYAVIIACIYPLVVAKDFDYFYSFFLVLLVSLGTFCEYFFGLSYQVLLNADQKAYILNYISFFVTIINFFVCILFIKLGLSIHFVKLASAIVLMTKPVVIYLYSKRKYKIKHVSIDKKEKVLTQKWSGFGVHVAYFLHRNTDVILITLFLGLTQVSIYSVYYMIVSGISTILSSLSLGFEAAFGELYARDELTTLRKSFKKYVTYYHLVSTVLFASTIVLITPFMRIYTAGIKDANYINVSFGILLVLAEYLYVLRVPFNDLMIATNTFKENSLGAFIEVAINIVCSIVLIRPLGISGVAVGTCAAMLFRLIFFIVFFGKTKVKIDVAWFIKNTFINLISGCTCLLIPRLLRFSCGNTYVEWILYSFIVVFYISIFCFAVQVLFNKNEICSIFKSIKMLRKGS